MDWTTFGLNLWNRFVVRDPGRPHLIVIEASTRCNRRCSYCPVAYFPRTETFLDTCAVIDQLAAQRYLGAIAWAQYDEPLMTPNFRAVMEYAIIRLPWCRHQINTNGDLLQSGELTWFAERAALAISMHSGHSKWISEWRNMPPRLQRRIRVCLPTPETAASRGGTVASVTPLRTRCDHDSGCIISATGHMMRCGDDYHYPQTPDRDVLARGIFEVWRQTKPFRDDVAAWRNLPDICEKCTQNLTLTQSVDDWLAGKHGRRATPGDG